MSKWSSCWTNGSKSHPWNGLRGQCKIRLIQELNEAIQERCEFVRTLDDPIQDEQWLEIKQGMLLLRKKLWHQFTIPHPTIPPGRNERDYFNSLYRNIGFRQEVYPFDIKKAKYASVLPNPKMSFKYQEHVLRVRAYYPNISYDFRLRDCAGSFYDLYCYINSLQYFIDFSGASYTDESELEATVVQPNFEYKNQLPNPKE